MPYIVVVKRPVAPDEDGAPFCSTCSHYHEGACLCPECGRPTPCRAHSQGTFTQIPTFDVSRHAVATLENARESTAYTVICIDQDCRRSSYEDAARSLPKAGGTVGPLPDGTVIEVKSIDWPDLFIDGGPALFSESDILDAYNAKNLVPAILDTAPGRKQDERGTRGGSA
jgi:hypothetical protein